MVAFIGLVALVIDFGWLSLNKNRLANAADAAALAGAQEYGRVLLSSGDKGLASTRAEVYARDYAQRNSVKLSEIEKITVNDAAYTVTVDVYRNDINLFFASAVGVPTGKRKAHAAAITGPISSYKGLVPVLFPASVAPKYGDVYTLKFGSGASLSPGEYGALDLGGKGGGGAEYEKYLKYGYDGTIKVGEVIPALDGNKIGETRDALIGSDGRITRCLAIHGGSCTYTDYKPGCPRLIIVPVCDISKLGPPDKEVTVMGFAAFFIKEYAENGPGEGDDTVDGYFIETMADGEVGGGTPGDDYGTWGVNLIE